MKKCKKLFVVFVGLAIGLALSGCQNPFLQIGKDAVSSAVGAPFMHADEIIQGDGTGVYPFLVYDIITLKRVGSGEVVDGHTWALDKHYLQIKDIDWAEAGEEWAPIGDYLNHFTGSYAGGGHTISNLEYIDNDDCIGLFAYINSGAKVKNLKLRDLNFKGKKYVGGIAGVNKGEILDCSVKGIISGLEMVGGIAGESYGLVERCSAGGTYSCTNAYGGGLIGNNYEGIIRDCYTAVVMTNPAGCMLLGGIAGESVCGTLINCYASTALSGSGFVGGIAGNFNAGAIKNCVALGGSVKAGYCYGRVIGDNTIGTFPWELSNNYANDEMEVNDYPITGYQNDKDGQDIDEGDYNDESWWEDNATWSSIAEAWDFVNVWAWDEVRQLPVLRGSGGQ